MLNNIGANSLIKLQILITFLITDLSLIQATISENSPINAVKSGNISISKIDDIPSEFPKISEDKDSNQGVSAPVIFLKTLLENNNKTVFDKVNRVINEIRKNYSTTNATTVILNNSDTTHPDTHIFNGNNDLNFYVEISSKDEPISSELKNENSTETKKSTIIFLVAVTLVSVLFYILLVSLRNILERKYGDRELLSQSEVKNDDYC